MNRFSTPDLNRMNSRELAAFQTDVLRGVAAARESQRKGEVLADQVRREITRKDSVRRTP